MTPTQRTLQLLRELGWVAAVVEKWIPQRKLRVDLFGFADIVAFNESHVLLVQASTTGNQTARIKKILALESAAGWANGPNRLIAVCCWKKYKRPAAGSRKLWRETMTMIIPLNGGLEARAADDITFFKNCRDSS